MLIIKMHWEIPHWLQDWNSRSVVPTISKQKNFDILKLLVEHPSLNKDLKDNNGETALDYVKALEDKEFYIDLFTKLSGIVQEE